MSKWVIAAVVAAGAVMLITMADEPAPAVYDPQLGAIVSTVGATATTEVNRVAVGTAYSIEGGRS